MRDIDIASILIIELVRAVVEVEILTGRILRVEIILGRIQIDPASIELVLVVPEIGVIELRERAANIVGLPHVVIQDVLDAELLALHFEGVNCGVHDHVRGPSVPVHVRIKRLVFARLVFQELGCGLAQLIVRRLTEQRLDQQADNY